MLLRCLSSARAFFSVVSAGTCIQCSKGKIITFSRPTRSLCTTNVQCPTVGEIIEQWSDRFENEGIPEPVASIEHIVAHVIGTSKVLPLPSIQCSYNLNSSFSYFHDDQHQSLKQSSTDIHCFKHIFFR